MTKSNLTEIASEVQSMPDGFFDEYENMMESFTEEEKKKIRKILEPEAKRRGLR